MEAMFLLVCILTMLFFIAYRFLKKKRDVEICRECSIPIGDWDILHHESFFVECDTSDVYSVNAIVIYDDNYIPSFCSSSFPFAGLRYQITPTGIKLWRTKNCELANDDFQKSIRNRGVLIVAKRFIEKV